MCSDPEDTWSPGCDGADHLGEVSHGGGLGNLGGGNSGRRGNNPNGGGDDENNNDIVSSIITGAPSGQEACEYILSGAPLACDPDNISGALDYWEDLLQYRADHYRFTAIGFGHGFSLGFSSPKLFGKMIKLPGWVGGVDGLIIPGDRSATVYGYYGFQSNGVSARLSHSNYLVIGLNIDDPSDYGGIGIANNLVIAKGGGVSLSYFWSVGGKAGDPDIPQGFTIGPVQGTALQASQSHLNYDPWFGIQVNPR